MLAIAGFLVRFALPPRFQLINFLTLSLIASVWILGPVTAAWMVGIGLLILTICHLPVSFRLRWGLLTALFAMLAVYRIEWLTPPFNRAAWPVLGGMFLFRTMIYLEDLRHEGRAWSWENALAYFFLLPSVCFSLFPVVDFKTFRRTQQSDDDHYSISQVGVQWMTRGVIHLVLYRFIYLYCSVPPLQVATISALVLFAVSGFALYLRVSGIFHLVVGMLHLFGFNLPETHHRYFLSSGVNDLWRRINIYWKDFMMKLFFYPAYFKLRARGTTIALVLATLYVVLVTWFLHCVQWFWILGSFPLRWQDGIFWSILAGLMTFGTIREMNATKRRRIDARSALALNRVRLLRIAATFIGMCILWSMWTSDSLAEWIAVWSVLGKGWATPGVARLMAPAAAVLGVLLLMLPTVVPEAAAPARALKAIEAAGRADGRLAFWRLVPASGACLVALVIAGSPSSWAFFGTHTADFAASLRSNRLNSIDSAKLLRGYYEDLLNTDNVNSRLWELGEKPLDWNKFPDGVARPTFDYRAYELAPLVSTFYKGARFSTNRWGMRDKDYSLVKPPNTYRIVAVGTSYVMGAGVADGETFESLLEDRLNRELTPVTGLHYEILNFGMAGYTEIQRVMELEGKAFAFQPDAVMYFAHTGDANEESQKIAKMLERGIEPPYSFVRNLMAQLDIHQGSTAVEVRQKMQPYAPLMGQWLLDHLQWDCRHRSVLLIWVAMPTPNSEGNKFQYHSLPPNSPGMVALSLEGAFGNQDIRSLTVAPWDLHPNASGHRMMADKLYADLMQAGGADLLRPDSIAMKFTQSPSTARLPDDGSQTDHR
jgi:hypothetical protein